MTKAPETAEDFLRLALDAEPKSELRRALLMSALMLEDPGLWETITGGPKRKRGRPKLTNNDVKIQLINLVALNIMSEHYFETGETKAQTLARAALESGKVPIGYADYNSVVERLARVWRAHVEKVGLPPCTKDIHKAIAALPKNATWEEAKAVYDKLERHSAKVDQWEEDADRKLAKARKAKADLK